MYIVFISALIFSGIETLDLHVQTLRPLDLYILDTLVRPLCPFWYPLSLNLSSLHTTSNSSPTSCWKVLRVLITFFFKKIGQPASFPFMSFQTNNTIFTTKQCEKCPSSMPFKYELSPITTRPGLPPINYFRLPLFMFLMYHFCRCNWYKIFKELMTNDENMGFKLRTSECQKWLHNQRCHYYCPFLLRLLTFLFKILAKDLCIFFF